MLPREVSAHKAHQITQQELAKMLDINQRTLSTIECCTGLITKQIKYKFLQCLHIESINFLHKKIIPDDSNSQARGFD